MPQEQQVPPLRRMIRVANHSAPVGMTERRLSQYSAKLNNVPAIPELLAEEALISRSVLRELCHP